MNNKLDPTVSEFKDFVNERPFLIEKVRKHEISWQELYEIYMENKDSDINWEDDFDKDTSRKKESKHNKSFDSLKESLLPLLDHLQKVDLGKVDQNVHQLNGAVKNIQKLIGQFKQDSVNNHRHPPFY
ncbi:spore coat protein YlbD [Saliterribacillus persicus]|uniref:Putative coat protein YlbD-like n=1 Tax=Saliterribacillus persicus TaxID=930114 RepID=A0A368XS89_9BACI|nr:spore coat protein YlbD [Saliterribacillus persicus]RCW70823.1 putative coat protein YlbD-like [Saliterribacillus persicus]